MKKKVIMIILTVIVILNVLWLMYVGYAWSWGPFSGFSDIRFRNLKGNGEVYALENVTSLKNSPLEGKHICYLGSSVTYGASSMQTSFAEYISVRNKTTFVKEAVGGTTLVDAGETSYVSRLKGIDTNANFDLFVCQLSTNDATQKKPLGTITPDGTMEFDTSTVYGAMEYIIAYVRDTWGCPVVFYTNSYYEKAEYAAMVGALYQLQEKYDIGIIDLYNDKEFNSITEDQRTLYMADNIHPTKAGYLQWWTPMFEKVLYGYFETAE